MTEQLAQALDVARQVGIPLDDRQDGFAWDGRTLMWRGRGPSDLIHDVAHWLVCASRRRRVANFGLGHSGEDDTPAYSPVVVRYCYADAEESRASALGIAIEAWLGWAWQETADDHNWSIEVDRLSQVWGMWALPLFQTCMELEFLGRLKHGRPVLPRVEDT